MADVFTREKRSRVMAAIKGRGNCSTEGILKQILRKHQLWGWCSQVKKLRGTPDVAFPGKKIAIFADGCFWHGCLRCGLRDRAQTNREFWQSKIARNIARDRSVTRALQKQGWRVLRLWEHDLEKQPELCLMRIIRVLGRKRGAESASKDSG